MFSKQATRNTTLISILMGTILEWYDFSLLGSMAPILSQLFFPSNSPLLSLLATFGVFASGFIARPLGSILFGHIGDTHGRRIALSLTILWMAVPTTLIGLLPTFQTAGIWAAVLLILLRLSQGIASSGEYPGAICFLTEIAPSHRKGYWGSLSMFGVAGGILLGSLVNSILAYYLSAEQMHTWGWRIPFLMGFPLGIIGWYLRYRINESEIYQNAIRNHKPILLPITQLLKTNWGNLSRVIALYSLSTISFYLGFVYISTYLVSLHKITFHEALFYNSLSTLVLIFLMPIFGYFSDFINRKYIMFAGALSLLILFYPIFKLFLSGNLLTGQILLAICIALYVGPLAAATSEFFTTLTRYSGIAIGLNIGASVFGGTCPLIATYLVERFQIDIIPCFYPIALAAICLLAIYSIRDNSQGKDSASC